MGLKVANSVVIVTGASAGIGRATAVCLAQAGANVVVTARRPERLAALLEELAGYPGERLAVVGDVQAEAFAQALIDRTVARFARLDVLVNNAGVGQQHALADLPASAMHQVLNTNVLGLMYLSQAAVRQMKQQGYGHLINVSSIMSQRPLPSTAFYAASKTAVNFLSRGLRMELKQHHIRVTLVYPGLTQTEFAQARLGQKGINRFGLRGVPAARVGQAIVKTIENGRLEVYITWYDWLIAHFSRLFPRTLDAILAQVVKL